MTETKTKPLAKVEQKAAERARTQARRPFDSLRRDVERLLDDFDRSYLRSPFRRSIFDIEPFLRREFSWGASPAVDIIEKDDAYEITAEVPGMDAKNIELKVSSTGLTIEGEKQEQKEEKRKDYYLQERRFGAFERHFALPRGVDTNKMHARFDKGVLTIALPKTSEARKAEKKIEVKANANAA
jgi:HSP20 family protein